jgi:FG-GAP repeat
MPHYRGLAAFIALAGTSACAWAQTCQMTRFAFDSRFREQAGRSVAACDGRLLMTRPGAAWDITRSRAWVMHWQNGAWSLDATFSRPVESQGDGFGLAAAMSASTAVVGAPSSYNPGLIGGAIHIFEWVGGSWSGGVRVLPTQPDHGTPGESEFFGWSVAISGDTILVGAYNESPDGAAYVFERDGAGGWMQTARLTPDDGWAWYFGWSVAIDGDTVVIGARNDFERGQYAGAAYVFERDGSGTWTQTAKLFSADISNWDGFGWAVAIHNGVIMVGAELVNHPPPANFAVGSVYVFERRESGDWAQTQQLWPPNPEQSDFFGNAIAMDGDLAVIGAQNYSGTFFGYGAAFVYHREATGQWRLLDTLMADDRADGDQFGYSVALSGKLAVVGAPFRDEAGTDDSGAAYVFAVGPDDDNDGVMDACECPGDADHDFYVGIADLAAVLVHFGLSNLPNDPDCTAGGWPTRCAGDLDADGDVTLTDLAIVLTEFGRVCP